MHLCTIKVKTLLLSFVMLLAVSVSAQDRMLNGRVVDDKGEAVIGALILEKGTQNGTTSGSNGNFSLRLSASNALLDVSYLGFTPKQVSVIAGTETTIELTPQATNIGAVEVIAIGHGTQKKASVVGAVSTVRADALRIPVRSLSQTLAGNIAGVISLQSSGEPGKDDAQFWIRGISTFTGDQKPLVLVDGIARPLNDVDPLEIESFSVLKDASATAIYGVEGANGVVIVTTRRGFDGPARIDARFEQGFSFPSKRLSFVDAATRAMLYNEAGATGGDAYLPSEITAMQNQSDPFVYPDVDWQELLMKDVALSQKVSANISGGGRFARYFAALSFYNSEGQYKVNPGKYSSWVPEGNGRFGKNVNYKRYNFRTNVDMDITNTTTITLGLQGNVTDYIHPNNADNDPTTDDDDPTRLDPIYRDIINAAPNAFPIILDDGRLTGRDGLSNPYNVLTQLGWKETTGNTLRANLRIDQDFRFITPGLRASLTYAYDAENFDDVVRYRDVFYQEVTGRDENTNELLTTERKTNPYAVEQDYLDARYESRSQRSTYGEVAINYARVFGEKHDVTGLVLGYVKDLREKRNANSLQYDILKSLPNRSMGIGARVTYGYDRRYLFEANLGFNGSENFPPGRKMGLFPAVALGWVPSEESFLKGNQVLTWMKIRGSWGQVGNDKIYSNGEKQRFVYMATINGNASGSAGFGEKWDGGKPGIGEGRPASANAQWEVATKYNLGIELGFWNAWSINADIFYDRREHIFIQPQFSELTGLPLADEFRMSASLGVMANRGFEISTEYAKNITRDFSIVARGNFTFARNELIYDGQYYENAWQNKIGTRVGEVMGYKAMHLFSQEELESLPADYTQWGANYADGSLRPGDIRYRDLNDDGRIDNKDMTWIGHPGVPEIVYGFGAEMKWRDFDFSFLFQGAANRSSYLSGSWYFQPFQADRGGKFMGNVMSVFLDRWTEDNPDPKAFSPRLSAYTNANNYQYSTWWQRSSDYLRLKNVTLGYTLPAKASQKLHISQLRFYVTGINLHTFSKFINRFWDPEIGADRYPLQRQVFVGLNLTF